MQQDNGSAEIRFNGRLVDQNARNTEISTAATVTISNDGGNVYCSAHIRSATNELGNTHLLVQL